ncbi:MAG: hypothetical protein NTNFB02_01830 [Nitrospira sp.]
MGNATMSLPVRFGEKPCVDSGGVLKCAFLKANVQKLAQGIKHSPQA